MFLFYVLSFFKKGDTIQGGTLFKGGQYLRKYSMSKTWGLALNGTVGGIVHIFFKTLFQITTDAHQGVSKTRNFLRT